MTGSWHPAVSYFRQVPVHPGHQSPGPLLSPSMMSADILAFRVQHILGSCAAFFLFSFFFTFVFFIVVGTGFSLFWRVSRYSSSVIRSVPTPSGKVGPMFVHSALGVSSTIALHVGPGSQSCHLSVDQYCHSQPSAPSSTTQCAGVTTPLATTTLFSKSKWTLFVCMNGVPIIIS
jgi:hypothetical protein